MLCQIRRKKERCVLLAIAERVHRYAWSITGAKEIHGKQMVMLLKKVMERKRFLMLSLVVNV